jgi:hypothetical protein
VSIPAAPNAEYAPYPVMFAILWHCQGLLAFTMEVVTQFVYHTEYSLKFQFIMTAFIKLDKAVNE